MSLLRSIVALMSPTPAQKIRIEATAPTLKHWRPSGSFTTDVVGESHYFDNIRLIAMNMDGDGAVVHCTAMLAPEEENPSDPNAVGVWIEGKKVGHLSKDEAPLFRQALTAAGSALIPTTCDALIHGGGTHDGRRYNYSVELDLLPTSQNHQLSSASPTYQEPIRSSPHPYIFTQDPDQHFIAIPCVDRATIAMCEIGEEVQPWTKPSNGDVYLFAPGSCAGQGRLTVLSTQRFPDFATTLERLEYLTIHAVDGRKVIVSMTGFPAE
ncbi:hypothetical protein ACEN88_00540 [Massilia sp. CT11-108]|uniref:hypothetical protein n=1 Tax=Massilia sp. CT11-108 TaxID=3393900 RepID=UPI0039A5A01C